MPTQRNTQAELPDLIYRGPFGGIQSELPLDAIEDLGFVDVVNLICRKGNITTRPGYTALPAIPVPAERIIGVADFFNRLGNRIQVVFTPTRMIQYNSGLGTWTVIAGGPLTGGPAQLMGWSVLDNYLLFSQGVDPVQKWDGVTPGFNLADAGAPPARYLCEMAFHLVLGYTVEGGLALPQQIRWSAALDPTDYTSFDAGFNPLANDLGPITGLAFIYQTGFVWQQKGIVQMIPTGVGTQPFDFVKIASKSYGNIAPYSLAAYGNQVAIYVGKDNVYLFDGVQNTPIGDAPMQGSRSRMGARARIFAELKLTDLSQVAGFITESIAGNPFNAYWLIIPGGSVWIYNMDESNWVRATYDRVPSVMGDFITQMVPRIEDLVGPISAQTWSPATLVANSPLDDLAIGFTDGTVGDVNFNTYSETAWNIASGQITAKDTKHNKLINRFRTIMTDLGVTTFNIQLINEQGQSITRQITTGSGSGLQLETIAGLEYNLSGMFIRYNIFGTTPISFSEFAFVYDIAGEFRGT